MPMKATGPKASAIVDLVKKCGPAFAEETDPFVQREALAELVSLHLLPLPEAQWQPVLENIMSTASGLAKMRAR